MENYNRKNFPILLVYWNHKGNVRWKVRGIIFRWIGNVIISNIQAYWKEFSNAEKLKVNLSMKIVNLLVKLVNLFIETVNLLTNSVNLFSKKFTFRKTKVINCYRVTEDYSSKHRVKCEL